MWHLHARANDHPSRRPRDASTRSVVGATLRSAARTTRIGDRAVGCEADGSTLTVRACRVTTIDGFSRVRADIRVRAVRVFGWTPKRRLHRRLRRERGFRIGVPVVAISMGGAVRDRAGSRQHRDPRAEPRALRGPDAYRTRRRLVT